jgi:tetratricopeptide (TPR) repeat protein
MALLWLLAAGAQAAELKETQINLEKAKLAISDQHYQEAAELLKPVVAVEPDNAEALRYLGLAQIGLSDFKAAEQSLARALKKDPSLLGARLDHAWAAIELKQPDPALADLEAVLAKEPDLPRAVYLQGHALMLKKDYAAAAAAFEKAAGLDPKLAQPALVYSGICQDKAGQSEKAKEALLNAQALDTSSPLGKAAGDYLDRLEGKAQPEKLKRFEMSASLLYQYDTNVAAVANEEELPPKVAHREDSRGVVLIGLLGRPLLTKNWETEANYAFYASQHTEADEFNLMVHQGTLGGTYHTNLSRYPLRLRLRASYQWAGLGEGYEYYSTTMRLLPAAFLQESDRTITEFSYYVESQTFDQPGEGPLDRDNIADQLLLAQYLGFLNNRAWLKLAARFTFVDANGQDYDSSRVAGLAELRLPLWKKAEGLAGFDYEYREYFNSTGHRRDEVYVYRAQVEQQIVKHLSGYISGVFNDYNSNLTGFTYDRNIFTAGLTGKF